MATISNTPRPGYAWDATDNCWYPIGTGPHTHSDYISQSTAINPTIVDAKGDIITATAADTPARLAVGTNGQVLKADSTAATGLAWGSAPAPSLSEQVFTSSGTWTAPAGVTRVEIVAVGAGGGGGGSPQGTGGGSGAYKTIQATVTPGTSYTVTVGAGGAGTGGYWAGGSDGTASSFGSVSADGGRGGFAMNTANFAGESAYGLGGANNGGSAGANTGGGGGGNGGGTSGNGGSGIVIVRWLA